MRLFVLLAFLAITPVVFAQQVGDTVMIERDTIRAEKDGTIPIETYAARYNPRKAMLYAAIFPGAGQVYNKKYWKLPLVYGGFFGLGYAININQTFYTQYKGQLLNILNEPASPVVNAEGFTALGNKVIGSEIVSPSGFRTDQLRNAVNRFRRDRDFSVLMVFVFYMMQMVDAHVDAHLKEFDVNPQLQVSLEPSLRNDRMTGQTGGLALTLKFK